MGVYAVKYSNQVCSTESTASLHAMALELPIHLLVRSVVTLDEICCSSARCVRKPRIAFQQS
jgi:hypothetical protein